MKTSMQKQAWWEVGGVGVAGSPRCRWTVEPLPPAPAALDDDDLDEDDEDYLVDDEEDLDDEDLEEDEFEDEEAEDDDLDDDEDDVEL